MRKILIPTNFTVESLQLVEYAILNYPDAKLDIKLIAGYKLPNTRWGITHFNEREQIRKLFNEDFEKAKRHLVFEYKKNIEVFSFELFTGANSFAFQNFLEQVGAEEAVVPKEKSLSSSNKNCFDVTNFIKKNVKNVIEVPVEFSEEVTERKFSLISLLNL
ncbi:hypothetical protein ULMS_25420 [Patiriisocius marinistellae]|uniref:Uncharacterized protein n=1 Tax=Patiriisocius marinistellae TaxID=2494560 RepID=A0A5J4G0J3_9FLAO|nr:hypothetical protein [Patiriisocius marinistellae]GEQ87034.1 hypothetical protein ULMS_25420 [Patiriisocius marinistellae]